MVESSEQYKVKDPTPDAKDHYQPPMGHKSVEPSAGHSSISALLASQGPNARRSVGTRSTAEGSTDGFREAVTHMQMLSYFFSKPHRDLQLPPKSDWKFLLSDDHDPDTSTINAD